MLGRGKAQKKCVLFLGVTRLRPDPKKRRVKDYLLWPHLFFRSTSTWDFWFGSWSGQHQKIHWDAFVETTSWKWNPLGLLNSKTLLISLCWRQQPHSQGSHRGFIHSFYFLITQPVPFALVDPKNDSRKTWYPPGHAPRAESLLCSSFYPQVVAICWLLK